MTTAVTFMSILGGLAGLALASFSGLESLLVALSYPLGGLLAVSALVAAALIQRGDESR